MVTPLSLPLPQPGEVWTNRTTGHRGARALVVGVTRRSVRYRPIGGRACRERSLTFTVLLAVWFRCWAPPGA